MKLSHVQDLSSLTDSQLRHIVFDGVSSDPQYADVALLLGSYPHFCASRAAAAATLYLEGYVPAIVPTGGVEWEVDGTVKSEADWMMDSLLAAGVPHEVIFSEKEARTTKENMLFGAVQINRALRFEKARRVCIVTSPDHMRRSLALARWLLPKHMEIVGVAASDAPTEWNDMIPRERAEKETRLLRGLIQNGFIEEIEF